MGSHFELDILIGTLERDERSAYFNLHPEHELYTLVRTNESLGFDEPDEGEWVTSAAVLGGRLGYHVWNRVGDDWVSPSGYVATWSGLSSTLSKAGSSAKVRAWMLTRGARNASLPLASIAVPACAPMTWIESEPGIFTPHNSAIARRLTLKQVFDEALEFRWI